MIVFDQAVLPFPAANKTLKVSMGVPTDRRVAILCREPSVQQLLVDAFSGFTLPISGRIERQGRISFPVGSIRVFAKKASLRASLSKAAELYGCDSDEVIRFVCGVAKLERQVDASFDTLSKGQQQHVATILGYALEFDTYLFHGSLGYPAAFLDLYLALFRQRTKNAGAILLTSDIQVARKHFDIGGVYHDGTVTLYENVADAISVFASRHST